MVKCKLCGYETKNYITNHLRIAHKISKEEYLKQFPNAEISSQEYKQKMLEHNRSQKMRETSAKNITKWNKENKHDKEWYKEWNRNPELIKKRNETRNKNKEWIKFRSEDMTKKNIENWKNPEYREKMSKMKTKQLLQWWKDHPEEKEKFRQRILETWKDPEKSKNMINGPRKSYFAKKGNYYSNKFNLNIRYDSSGEKDFLEICNRRNSITSFEREPLRISYIDENGKERIYIPDYVVEENKQKYVIEIKFNEKIDEGRNKYKVKSAIEYCNKNNLKYCFIRRFKELPLFANGELLEKFALN